MITRGYLAAAHARIQLHDAESATWKKAYTQFAKKLPGLIQVSGLAQAKMFVDATGEPWEQAVLRDMCQLLVGQDGIDIASMSVHDYQRTVRRAQQALVVIKRLSQSLWEE